MSRAREGTVRNLQELYTVAVGVALVLAIEQVVRISEHPARGHIDWVTVPAFVAFLVTLIPFFHGALRHLDRRYVEEGGRKLKRGALLADFLLLFVEACVLLGIARLLSDVSAVAIGLSVLLLTDALWSGGVYLVFTKANRTWEETAWLRINLIFGPIFMAVGLLLRGMATPSPPSLFPALAISALAAARTGLDYWVSWEYYFPSHQEQP